MLIYGNIVVNPESKEVTCRGKKVTLKPKEYELLTLFLQYPDHVLTHDVIVSQIWDSDKSPCDSTLRSHIKTLRKHLQECGESDDIIETVHGLGYRLNPLKKENPQPFPPISTLKKYLISKGIEYLVIDEQYIIKFFSSRMVNYSDYPDKLQIGHYVGDAFPELIGLEEDCEKVRNGEEEIFILKGIARAINPQRPEYINFYIIGNNWENSSLEEKPLFVFVEDDSENYLLRRNLVQQLNERLLANDEKENSKFKKIP